MQPTDMKHKLLKASRIPVLCAFLVLGIALSVYLTTVQEPITQTVIEPKRVPTLVTADGPGDTTCLRYIQIRPHAADPGATYISNVTNASAYEYAPTTAANASATGTTPFGTAFDIVVGVAVDYDDGYNQTDSRWDEAYNWVTLTCADLSIGANTNMTEYMIANNTATAWYNYVLNGAGAGYTIALGESYNLTSIKFWVMAIVT